MRPIRGWLVRNLVGTLILAACLPAPAAAEFHVAIRPAQILQFEAGRVVVRLPFDSPTARLLVVDERRILGWFDPTTQPDATADRLFQRPRHVDAASAGSPRAWLVDLVEALPLSEPLAARSAFHATIDSVGAGGQTAWLRAGSNVGVPERGRWWQRIDGQPVARFDSLLVSERLTFARVTPLAEGWLPAAGQTVAFWPDPATGRAAGVHSAVTRLEESSGDPLAWIAAPTARPPTTEAAVEFVRDGRYVGIGSIERADPRFWYVRLWPAACAEPVQVGDGAVLRSQGDLDAGRLNVRVVSVQAGAILLNSGEADGLTPQRVGEVLRGGVPVGRVRVQRVNRAYAIAQAVESAPPPAIERMDEVRFGPDPPTIARVAQIDEVVDETAFSATRWSTAWIAGLASQPERSIPIGQPLLIQSNGRTIGLAVAVAELGDRLIGAALPRSLAQPLSPGQALAIESP